MSEITIPVNKFQRLVAYLRRIGLDSDAIAARAHPSLLGLGSMPPEASLPARYYGRFYRAAVEEMQALKRPIPWAAGIGSEAFELMCHCIITARTLGDALGRAARFERLVYPLVGYKLLYHPGPVQARVEYRINPASLESSLAPDSWNWAEHKEAVAKASGLLAWHALCGWLVGRNLQLQQVTIAAPYVNRSYEERLARVFQCPIQFNAAATELVLPSASMQLRLVHTPASLEEFLAESVYHLIAMEHSLASTSSAIKSLVCAGLPGELPTFADIAHALHTSESSLRRRLAGEGTSYQAIKDEVRRDIATDHLLDGSLTVTEIADMLGFSEPGSFVRSFRGWTGQTPAQYRRSSAPERPRQVAVAGG